MRILITGGFGFLGGRLGQHFCQVGHQVVLGSRNASGPPNWLPYAEVAKIDWNDAHALEQTCNGVDVLIHAAGMNALDCATNPVAALEVNGFATARLLDAAIQSSVKRFIYLSSAHVYASPLIGTITEETCPSNLHPYATSHLAGENVVLGATQRREIEGFVLRLSNVFGVPMHKDVNCWMLLVNDLCRQIVTERRLTLKTAGLQRRDFLTLEDFCCVLTHVIGLDKKQFGKGVFNVGGNWAPRVIDMVELIRSRCSEVLGFTPDIIRPESAEEVMPLDLDYKTTGLIASGFKSSMNVDAEIDATLLFCREAFGDNQ
jgi:UDP-glucose 4-epimerase